MAMAKRWRIFRVSLETANGFVHVRGGGGVYGLIFISKDWIAELLNDWRRFRDSYLSSGLGRVRRQ